MTGQAGRTAAASRRRGGRNLQVRLARVVRGVPAEDCFELAADRRPAPQPGQVLMRVIDLSLDPYLRAAIAGRHLGSSPVGIGEVVPGRSLARVVASRDPRVADGSLVLAQTGWQEWSVADAAAVEPVEPIPGEVPPSAALGVLGMPGLTAYVGVTRLLCPSAGQVFAVSAPLGPVGSTAATLARIRGCRTIGITSSAAKCSVAVGQLGFDACVNRRSDDWQDRLRAACPDGIDHYFDNSGGAVLNGVVSQLRRNGRVVLCGLMDQYNDGPPTRIPAGPLIGARATVMGLVVYDHEHLRPEFVRRVSALVRDGRVSVLEDRAHGLDQAPAAFCRLMRGLNVGKALVRVSDPDD